MAKISILRMIAGILTIISVASCASEKDYLITIDTEYGKMYAILYDETPVHKENFIALAEAGRYDSTTFYRIIEDFMIQGGDVFNKENLDQEDWYTLPAEFNEDLIHEKGSIAAARQGNQINPEMRSSGCQFYIVEGKVYEEPELTTDLRKLQQAFAQYLQLETNLELREKYAELYKKGEYDSINSLMLSNKVVLEKFFNLNLGLDKRKNQVQAYTTVGGTPHLDDTYTVFGKVIKGIDVLDEIASLETGSNDLPITPVYMKVNVEYISKKKIAKEYGYQYPQK
ncbi:peptidylprolyl isomerase [Cyclobacterium marinum]|uniref:Peptidyl-prolyl cis-trans isomerase n=1 Tax=Cyclobacterium marinum (strain ATCC 25205 / DSM 745 / LMG 13164 / NCIMB 1802) TaxID=880070 RepID=G0J3E0_CYCMS|nr:peptidylprolyl isomerase [Cyclobacterium marinum]AEL24579.1 peptidyl-prolyl cis-trans isomerase cyclophilin type [Cyclobacterium marinum DSM 745]